MSNLKDFMKEPPAQALYREIMADMRALRDVEMKFVPFFFQIAAFVVTGNIVLIVQGNSLPKPLVVTTGILSVVFTVLFAGMLVWKIGHDHENHKWLGLRAQALWQCGRCTTTFLTERTTAPGMDIEQISGSSAYAQLLLC